MCGHFDGATHHHHDRLKENQHAFTIHTHIYTHTNANTHTRKCVLPLVGAPSTSVIHLGLPFGSSGDVELFISCSSDRSRRFDLEKCVKVIFIFTFFVSSEKYQFCLVEFFSPGKSCFTLDIYIRRCCSYN